MHGCLLFRDLHMMPAMLQGFEGVEAIQEGINPATWMLEQTGANVERKTGHDFAELFEQSDLNRFEDCPTCSRRRMASTGTTC